MKLLVKNDKDDEPVLRFSLSGDGEELDLIVEDWAGNDNCLLTIVEIEGELVIRRHSLRLGFERLFRTDDRDRPEVVY